MKALPLLPVSTLARMRTGAYNSNGGCFNNYIARSQHEIVFGSFSTIDHTRNGCGYERREG